MDGYAATGLGAGPVRRGRLGFHSGDYDLEPRQPRPDRLNIGNLDPTGLTLTYDVYFGTDQTAVENAATDSPEYMANVDTESYDFNDLDPETEYFWRVDTSLAIMRPPFTPTITPGDVWSFTTAPPGTGRTELSGRSRLQ